MKLKPEGNANICRIIKILEVGGGFVIMKQVMVVYKYQDKNEEIGEGRDFYKVPHTPMTMGEIQNLEKTISESQGFEMAFLLNIVPLAAEMEEE